jgi:hypothetical protein
LIGKAFELVARVEALRLLVLGIEQNGHDPDVFGGAKHPVQGVHKEVLPQSAPLKSLIHREAGEPRHRDGKAREPLRRVCRQIVAIDRAGRDGVVTQHLPWAGASRRDEGFRDA